MKSNYEERKQNRINRFEELASKARSESTTVFSYAQKISSFIPMGQPILVGHHSEKSHRRDLNKIDNAMRKSIELDKKAEYYNNRAEAAEDNNAISSDDPQAVEKLAKKIENMEKAQALMKAANVIIRNKKMSEIQKVEALEKLGLSNKNAIERLQPDFCGRIGFADYKLQNNNANLARCKKRLAELQKAETQTTTEKKINGVKIVDNVEENRLQLFFPGKPSDEIRTQLHRSGFHWSGFLGCWQRFRSNAANYEAERILKLLS